MIVNDCGSAVMTVRSCEGSLLGSAFDDQLAQCPFWILDPLEFGRHFASRRRRPSRFLLFEVEFCGVARLAQLREPISPSNAITATATGQQRGNYAGQCPVVTGHKLACHTTNAANTRSVW
jgi:hypothetical protein